jgi:Na+/H+ antiporter NhaD/arsenite permease-like protein
MFAGLYIIVAGAQHPLLTSDVVAAVRGLHIDQIPVLTAVLSNLVGNVPAVLMLKPFVVAARSRQGMAHNRDGIDACQQFHGSGLGRQPH